MQHRLAADLAGKVIFPTAVRIIETPEGYMFGAGTTVGNSVEGWAPNAQFIKSDGGAATRTYINKGTKAAATWVEISTLQDAEALVFGTGSDVSLAWDGTTLNLAPSSGFWSGCPLVNYPGGHTLAYEFFDDFTSFNVGDVTSVWTLGTNTNGTVVLGLAETANTPGAGGYVSLHVDGTAQYDYVTIRATSTATGTMCRVLENSGQKLWFECNITVGTVTDCYFMVGLMAPGADDITTDATGAENVADGFYFRTLLATETELDTATNQNTTETEIGGNVATIAANGNYTLGIYFDGVTTLTFYVDGVALTDTVTIGDTGNIPNDVGLVPVFHVKDGTAGGTADDLIHIDWVKIVQLR